jgi:copper homeostasis protein
MLVEAYVETDEQAERAIAEGADRLEVCGPGEGGLTPALATVGWLARSMKFTVHAMVRPRAGDFVYDAVEFEKMRRVIPRLREHGASGVVFGVLHEGGTLDLDRMAELVAMSDGMRVVCHRAFDSTPDADEALEQLIQLGVHEVLTSGHAATAMDGAETLKRHVQRAAGRTEILAGGGVRPHNVRELVTQTGVQRVHARAFEPQIIRGIRDALRG